MPAANLDRFAGHSCGSPAGTPHVRMHPDASGDAGRRRWCPFYMHNEGLAQRCAAMGSCLVKVGLDCGLLRLKGRELLVRIDTRPDGSRPGRISTGTAWKRCHSGTFLLHA